MIMKRRFYVLAFLIPIVTWLAIFAVWGQYPFGDKTLLIWDANFQFVSFFAKWHDILHGKAGFFYSLSDSLGGNIYSIGAYYYLFSPLHLLTFFFKKESLYKCLCLIFFIKIGFMGVSLFHYLDYRHEGKNQTAALPSVAAYTVSSYLVAYSFNIMWLDALILLPLVILGVDRILSGRTKEAVLDRYLVVFVALSVITNFYTAVIISIFTAFYFLFGIILCAGEELLQKCIKYAASMAVGIGLSSFVILPCFVTMMHGSRFSGDIDMSVVNQGALHNLFWGSMPFEQITLGIPMYYCGMLVLLLCAVFFISRKTALAGKINYILLLAVIVLSTRFKALDVAWGLGHESSGCPYRYSFLAVFIICMLASDAIIILLAEKSRMSAICIVLTLIVAADLGSNAIYFYKNSKQHESRGAAEYTGNSLWLQNTISKAELEDGYRTEYGYLPNMLMNNLPFYLNTHGVSAYTSMEENRKVEIIEKLGYVGSYDGYNLEFNEDNTLSSQAVLGIRYIVTGRDKPGVRCVCENDELKVYDTEAAFPVSYMADAALKEVRSEDYSDYFSWMNAVFSKISGNDNAVFEPFEVVSCDVIGGNIDGEPTSCTALGSDTQLVINLAPQSGEEKRRAYLRYGFEEPDGVRFNAYVDGEDIDIASQENMVKYLGETDGDSLIILAVTLDEGAEFDIEKLGVYVENEDVVRQACDGVNSQDLRIIAVNDDVIEVEVTSGSDGILVVSVPNDSGWRVYVDGKRTGDVTDVIDGLMGIQLPEGIHTVRLKYYPPGLGIGFVISMICCGLFALSILREKRSVESAKKETAGTNG